MNGLVLNDADADLLRAHFNEEESMQQDLDEALDALEDLVVRNDLDGLHRRLEMVGPLLGRLETLVRRRERVVGRFAARLGVSAGPGLAASLLAALPVGRRDELSGIHRSLMDRTGGVQGKNRRLRVIVGELARLNREMVRAAFGLDHAQTTYDRGGRTREEGNLAIMDRRI
ncbi:MAG: flagellar export chaperone FlgN [Planctomycetota bacterium]